MRWKKSQNIIYCWYSQNGVLRTIQHDCLLPWTLVKHYKDKQFFKLFILSCSLIHNCHLVVFCTLSKFMYFKLDYVTHRQKWYNSSLKRELQLFFSSDHKSVVYATHRLEYDLDISEIPSVHYANRGANEKILAFILLSSLFFEWKIGFVFHVIPDYFNCPVNADK